MNNFIMAESLEKTALQMIEKTDDPYRLAEINNVRAMLTIILSGLLSEEDDDVITEVSKRLLYLHQHPKSSGMHSQYPNPINKGVIRER